MVFLPQTKEFSMAPARCEANMFNAVVGKHEQKVIAIVHTGEVRSFGDFVVRGTEDGFTLRKGEEERIERVCATDTDEYSVPADTRRIPTPLGLIDVIAVKK